MTINLIPPKLKREKEYTRLINLCFSSFSVILLILAAFAAGTYIFDLYVKSEISSSDLTIQSQNQSLEKQAPVQKKIDIINSKLEKIDSINSDRVIWSNVLKDLANDTPGKVQIKTLSLSSETKQIALTGLAETRRDIAALKEKMEASKYFKNVTFSTSSHSIETGNFNFSMSCELENNK